MKKRHILHWAMGVVMTPLLGSCAFDELHEIAGGGNGMSFSVEVTQLQEELGSSFRAPRITDTEISGDGMKMYVRRTTEGYVHRHEAKGVATRGTSVTSIDKFILNSYTYSTSLSSATQVSNNEEITKSGGWKSQKQWQKASDKMAFYAYNAGTSSATFSFSSGNPTLQYIVADEVANQQDLLVAKAENVTGDDTNKNIALTFSHALTAVQFGIGSTMADGTIKKIELQGIKNQGTYNYSDDTWTSQNGSQTYTLNNLSIDISNNKGTAGTKIITGNGSNDLMLLMPQTLGSEAKLVVTIESNEVSHDLTMNLSGDWSPGHTVTYSLSTDKEEGTYVLKVSNSALTIDDKDGGSVSTQVMSYYQDYYGTQKAVAWTATYAFASGTDERTPLDKAITAKTTSGSGGAAGENFSATIAKQYLKSQYNFNIDADLKSKAQNSASPFDLSTYSPATGNILSGSDTRSANCYIIKAPGYYKLPLVYGNTLNNLNNANGNGSETFKNAYDTKITSADISGVKGAKLLWQDEYGLIDPTSIRVADNYLYFEIKEGSITQGNALIAATSGENGTGDILWSWHIWVTDADFQSKVLIYGGASFNYNTSSTSGKKEFNFMKMPLGFCNSTTLKYPERKIVATIKQTGIGGNETNVTITQTGSSSAVKSYGENCTFYQWGRKDPFPGSDGIKTIASNSISTPKYCYDADGNSFEYNKVGGDTSNGRTSKGGSIKNPYTFFYSLTTSTDTDPANDWCNETTYNNWSSNDISVTFVDHTVVKSLYDPCPIGFKVPETTSFTGFTKTGDNVGNNSSYYNVTPETYNQGWYFCTTGWRTGATDFWRAFGFIDCWSGRYVAGTGRGFLGWSGLYGFYWSARAYSAGYGRYLNFNSGYVNPRDYNRRAYGFSVRPVSE